MMRNTEACFSAATGLKARARPHRLAAATPGERKNRGSGRARHGRPGLRLQVAEIHARFSLTDSGSLRKLSYSSSDERRVTTEQGELWRNCSISADGR